MRTLWVFCAFVVLFTMHCLTVPRQRQPVISTGQAPQSGLEKRNSDAQLTADDDNELDREIAEIKSHAASTKTIIERVTLSGNTRLSQDILAFTIDEQCVKVGTACDPARNYDAAHEIEWLYEILGYYSARVTLASGRSHHDSAVSFEIDEGPQGMLTDIVISGNKTIPSKVLRPLLASRMQSLPNDVPWFLRSSRESAWNRKSDEYVLRMHYLRQGFYNAQISHVKRLSEDRTRLTVEYIIDERERIRRPETTVNIVFRENSVFPEENLRNALTVQDGGQ